jgi:hypothetical protein
MLEHAVADVLAAIRSGAVPSIRARQARSRSWSPTADPRARDGG